MEAVRNGAEALELVEQHDTFHLILLDVQIPVLDGWFTIVELRASDCDTPVVMMSGHATEFEALRASATALLPQPFDHADLANIVARWAVLLRDAAAG